MKVAFITEGLSEYQALPLLFGQLKDRTGSTLLNPTRIPVSPDAPLAKIVSTCKPQILIAAKKGASRIIILLDREQRHSCPGLIAAELESALAAKCSTAASIHVVIKDRSFENWLISDVDALIAQPKRFKVSKSLTRAVKPDKADSLAAYDLLNRAAIGAGYDKIRDSRRICNHMNIDRAGANSRSFRHLLHLLGHCDYPVQCKRPARG